MIHNEIDSASLDAEVIHEQFSYSLRNWVTCRHDINLRALVKGFYHIDEMLPRNQTKPGQIIGQNDRLGALHKNNKLLIGFGIHDSQNVDRGAL